jgi:hypothetical protein
MLVFHLLSRLMVLGTHPTKLVQLLTRQSKLWRVSPFSGLSPQQAGSTPPNTSDFGSCLLSVFGGARGSALRPHPRFAGVSDPKIFDIGSP